MGILSGNPKEEPMHYGEVYSVWMHLSAAKASVAAYETLLNHAGDEDLQKIIKDIIEDTSKQEIEEVERLLTEHGIGMPPTPAKRPEACIEKIPAGARFLDQEIANKLSADIAAGLISCSTVMGQCIREDIASMYANFHTKKAQYATKVLRLLKDKGWLIPPPLHIDPSDC
ncbi:DUF3231 family protein [Mesobacillus maritimus]|uniref:DUF3231 family protein n=1 Tax=Mesobacillus maritimus TaxID=1643336 RepID=UPI00203A9999|nr:DUF3231 family protein [Mesobacillus maritimus]MCM3588099.1 DUF3231 family protein [Mesobacillus maritimus]MCM3668430.1 DUF3231 family protein [Mesobacillus maritimus]